MIQFLAQDLATFLAANPHVRIELEDALSDRTIHALENGQAEIGIFADNVPAPGLHIRPYRRDRQVVRVPQTHALAQHASVNLADTLDSTTWRWTRAARRCGVSMTPQAAANA